MKCKYLQPLKESEYTEDEWHFAKKYHNTLKEWCMDNCTGFVIAEYRAPISKLERDSQTNFQVELRKEIVSQAESCGVARRDLMTAIVHIKNRYIVEI